MQYPSADFERFELVNELAATLLAGRHCMLLGHDLVAKTPVLKDLECFLRDRRARPVAVALMDIEARAGNTWADVGAALLAALGRAGFPLTAPLPEDWHLHDLLAEVLDAKLAIRLLVLLIDHMDTLRPPVLQRFARECSALVNLQQANPERARVSILWCGDESRMVAPICRTNSFPQDCETWRVSAYSPTDIGRLLERYEGTFRLRFPEDARTALSELTGGNPTLLRHYGDSFMKRLVESVQDRLFVDVAGAARQVASEYVSTLMATVGAPIGPPHEVTAKLANAAVERITGRGDLLSLVMCLRMAPGHRVPSQEFPGVAETDDDLFVTHQRTIRVRGRILEDLILSYFTYSRLAYHLFCLDRDRSSWSKAILCSELARDEGCPGSPLAAVGGEGRPSTSNPDESSSRFLAALSDRLHACRTAEEVLDSLQLTIRHFLGTAKCAVFEVRHGAVARVKTPANVHVPAFMGVETGPIELRHLPESVRVACEQAKTTPDEETGNLALPLTVGSRVGYVVWLEREESGTAFPALAETVVHIAEGPLAAAVSYQQQSELLHALFQSNREDRMQVIDRHGRTLLASPRLLRDAEPQANIIGRKCRDVWGNGHGAACACEQVFRDRKEYRNYHRRGGRDSLGHLREMWLDVHAWPLFDPAGETAMVCQVARDVTPSVRTLEATEKLLGASDMEEALGILIRAAELLGFRRGRVYMAKAPSDRLVGDVVSKTCFGHDEDFTREFNSGHYLLDGDKEAHWYEPFRKYGRGVICVRSERPGEDRPAHEGAITRVHVSRDREQIPELRDSRDVRCQTALEAEGTCYGTLVCDMGSGTKHISEHLWHRLFGLASMAAQTMAVIDYRKRLQTMLRGFRHSVAQPLGAMKLAIEAYAESGESVEKEAAASLAIRQVDALKELGDNLLACMQQRRTTTLLKEEDIVPAVQTVVDACLVVVTLAGIHIEYEGPDEARALTERSVLSAILRNLIDNAVIAVQAASGRSGKVVIVRIIAPNGEAERIEVEDNGFGVPDHLVNRVFQEGVSDFGSTGMGLAASRFFAKLINATVTFWNKPGGEGAIFTLDFTQGEPGEQEEEKNPRC